MDWANEVGMMDGRTSSPGGQQRRSSRSVMICLSDDDAARLDEQFGAGFASEILHLACCRVHVLLDGYSEIPLALTVRVDDRAVVIGLPDERRLIDELLGSGTSAHLAEVIAERGVVERGGVWQGMGIQRIESRLEATLHAHAALMAGEATVLGVVAPAEVARGLSSDTPENAVRLALSVGMPLFYGIAA